MSVPSSVQVSLTLRDGMTLPELIDVVRAVSVDNLARLREVHEPRKRFVHLADVPDRVGRAGDEGEHQNHKKEHLADGKETCAR